MPLRRLSIALATLAVAAVLPAAASADSIVYLKDGNVWIANADGSGARQFTLHQYGWRSPSEADDGTVVAAGGLARTNPDGSDSDGSSELYRFQPDGNQIGTFTPTYGSYSTPACPSYPPSRVRVAPDGSKIAYGIMGCGAGGYETALWTPAGSTGLDFPNQHIGQQDFWNPIWIDSSRFTISHSGPPVFGGSHWGEHEVSDGDNVGGGWYESAAAVKDRAADAVISRDGATAVAFFEDHFDYTDGKPRNVSMWVYHNGSVPSDWTHNSYGNPVCQFDLDATKYSNVETIDPSLSPDAGKITWGDDDGVEQMSLGDLTNSCAGHSSQATIVPGGSEPFYSKGDLQPGAANPNQPGGENPPPPPPPGAKPHAKFAITTKKSKRHAHRKITFDARKSSEANGQIASYRWKFGDGKKGHGRKVSHKYRHKGKYKVTLTVVDAAGNKATAHHTVKVKR